MEGHAFELALFIVGTTLTIIGALICAVAWGIWAILLRLVDSVEALNIQVGVVVNKVDSHGNRMDSHENRITQLEHPYGAK